MLLALGQSMSAVYKSSVNRSQILDQVLAVPQRNARVPPRHLRLWIVSVKIDIGEDSAVGIPAANVRVLITQGKLLARGAAALDHKHRMHSVFGRDQRR